MEQIKQHKDSYKFQTDTMDLTLTFPDKYLFLEDCTESMLFPSGTDIAILSGIYYGKKVSVELKVVGDVKVYYDGTIYKDIRQFPDELVAYMEENYCISNENIEFVDTNWFQFDVFEDEEFINDFVCESDLSDYSVGDLMMEMIEYLDYIFEYDKEEEKENE